MKRSLIYSRQGFPPLSSCELWSSKVRCCDTYQPPGLLELQGEPGRLSLDCVSTNRDTLLKRSLDIALSLLDPLYIAEVCSYTNAFTDVLQLLLVLRSEPNYK